MYNHSGTAFVSDKQLDQLAIPRATGRWGGSGREHSRDWTLPGARMHALFGNIATYWTMGMPWPAGQPASYLKGPHCKQALGP